jgi:hypothetical protein
MTEPNATDRVEIPEAHSILEAFIDGERVDREALKAALEDPAGRDCLMDLLALRDAVGAMGPKTWSAINRPSPAARRVRWAAAAALLAGSVSVGYLAGQRTVEGRTIQRNVAAVVNLTGAPPAPAPTKVITLRPGVNWTDSKGEQ